MSEQTEQLEQMLRQLELFRNQLEQMQFFVNQLELASSIHDQITDLEKDIQNLIDGEQ